MTFGHLYCICCVLEFIAIPFTLLHIVKIVSAICYMFVHKMYVIITLTTIS